MAPMPALAPGPAALGSTLNLYSSAAAGTIEQKTSRINLQILALASLLELKFV
jgi:hypothetical protein